MKIQYFGKKSKGVPYDYLGYLFLFSRNMLKIEYSKVNLVFVIRQK